MKDTRKRWNHLLTLLLRTWPTLQGLRVFELHESQGLHVHLVTNQFIDVNRARELATGAGWGRIHVARMPSEHAGYLAKYLSKERPEWLHRWRLWAGFGQGWEWTKVKDNLLEDHLVLADAHHIAVIELIAFPEQVRCDWTDVWLASGTTL